VNGQGFAVAVCRESGRWRCDLLPPALLEDLAHSIAALRQQQSEGGPLALLNVEDEFFVALRIRADGSVGLLLSDLTAAADWELAAQAADFLDEDLPADSDDVPETSGDEEIRPVGDLGLFADLGLPAEEMRIIVGDIELYADEMLARVAGTLGFGAQFEEVVGTPLSR